VERLQRLQILAIRVFIVATLQLSLMGVRTGLSVMVMTISQNPQKLNIYPSYGTSRETQDRTNNGFIGRGKPAAVLFSSFS
jgi:hypothetical protein